MKRRFKIKHKGLLDEDRKRIYIVIESIIYILIILCIFSMANSESVTPALMFLLFCAIFIARGFEEWKEDRQSKAYYHEWLLAATIAILYITSLIMN